MTTKLKANDIQHDVQEIREDIKLWHPDNRPVITPKIEKEN